MTSSADHAATVRSALQLDEQVKHGNAGPLASLAALVALAERATELERERDEARQRLADYKAGRL